MLSLVFQGETKRGEMGLYLKITVVLLLFVQTFHLAALQDSTDSPGRTIDKSWLRDLAKKTAGRQNGAAEEETEDDQRDDANGADSNNDYSSGVPSGSMQIYNDTDTSVDKSTRETSYDVTTVKTTEVPAFPNATVQRPELTTAAADTDSTNSSQTNMTETKEEFNNATMSPQNSTAEPNQENTTNHLIPQNSTGTPEFSNHTDLQTTATAPEVNVTQEVTTKSSEDRGLINVTTIVKTTAAPHINETSTTSSPTTASPNETTETIPKTMTTTTAAAPKTPEKTNLTDKNAASGSSSERGTAAVSGVRLSGAHFYIQKMTLCVFLAA